MSKRKSHLTLVAAGAAILSLCAWAGTGAQVPYPLEYRKWVHVKSALVGPQGPGYEHFGGLHHIYAAVGDAVGSGIDGEARLIDRDIAADQRLREPVAQPVIAPL